MDKKPYLILVSSNKGGVGKSIISVSIASSLRAAGYSVLVIDTDVANPSIGPLLGMREPGSGFAEIIDGAKHVEDTMVAYVPLDFYLIPAGGKALQINIGEKEAHKFYTRLLDLKFDFVIIDTPPGFNMGPALRYFSEALIITTPEETSVFGAEKLSKLYADHKLLHKLVINRVKDNKFELDEQKIEQIYGDIAYAMVPESDVVVQSEAEHKPAYIIDRSSLFSKAIDDLCRSYILKAGEPPIDQRSSPFKSIKKLFGFK